MRTLVFVDDEPHVLSGYRRSLQDLREELNLTYIFISHDLSVVEYMADYVAVMYLGRFVEVGPAKQVLNTPKHPYTQALLDSILTPDAHLGLPQLDLRAGFPDPLNPPPGCRFHPRCVKAMDVCSKSTPKMVRIDDTDVECHLYPAKD